MNGVEVCIYILEKAIEMTKFHMAIKGGTILTQAKEDSSTIFFSMESSQRATNDSNKANSICGSSNTISSEKVVVTEMFNTQCKEEAKDAMVEFYATNSPLYKEMTRKFIIIGHSFQLHGQNKMRTTMLESQRCQS